MTKSFSVKITYFSFFFAIMLVFYHWNPVAWSNYTFNSNILIGKLCYLINRFFDMVGGYSVSFFFTNSAFLLYYNLDSSNIYHKLKRRIFSLILPFIIWNCIYFFALYYQPNGQHFFSIIKKCLISPYCGTTWFIEAILFYIALILPLYILMKKPIVSEIILISVFYFSTRNNAVFNLLSNSSFGQSIHLTRFFSYIPSYFIGIYLALRLKDYVLNNNYENRSIRTFSIMYLLLSFAFGASYCYFFPLALWCSIPNSFFENKSIKYIDCSFIVFVFHPLILDIYKKLSTHDTFNLIITKLLLNYENSISDINMIYNRLFLGLIFSLACVIFANVIKFIFPRLYTIIVGMRSEKHIV